MLKGLTFEHLVIPTDTFAARWAAGPYKMEGEEGMLPIEAENK